MKKVSLVLLIIWLIFIFVMSSFPGSKSSNQSGFFVDIASKIVPVSKKKISFFVRKLAHFTEYFILGLLMINCLRYYGKRAVIQAIIFCLLYAISDEIHQYFVPQRAMRALDVCIDFFGSLSGILLFFKVLK